MKSSMRLAAIGFGCLLLPSLAWADRDGKGPHGPDGYRHGGFKAAREIVREFCQKNPEDSRCLEIKSQREAMKAKFEACKADPSQEGCERMNAWRERKKEKCAANPEKPFCKRFESKQSEQPNEQTKQ